MTSDQLHPAAGPAAPRTLDDWTAYVACAALVAGGFLVSIAGPMLRKLYAARVAELAEVRAELGGLAELGADHAATTFADELDGQAAAEAPPPGADVWAAATGNGSADYAAEAARGDG